MTYHHARRAAITSPPLCKGRLGGSTRGASTVGSDSLMARQLSNESAHAYTIRLLKDPPTPPLQRGGEFSPNPPLQRGGEFRARFLLAAWACLLFTASVRADDWITYAPK